MSDLLDYINPSPDAKGRDVGSKRRGFVSKVRGDWSTISLFLAYDFPIRISMIRFMEISLDEDFHLMQTCYKISRNNHVLSGRSTLCNTCLEEERMSEN